MRDLAFNMPKIVAAALMCAHALSSAENAPKAPSRIALGETNFADSWVTKPIMAPRVEFKTFDSLAATTKVSFHIYTPEVYDAEREQRFPVLYWLHGSGGGLGGIAPLSALFDRAIREGKIPPMLIVFPNGMAKSLWCDSKDGSVPMETVVVKELVPYVDATFRTIATRQGRLVEGFSMGGYGAARLGFKFPEVFGSVSILAGGPLDLEFQGPRAKGNPIERERILKTVFGGELESYKAQSPLTLAEQHVDVIRGRTILRQAVGDRDFTAGLNTAFAEQMKKLQIPCSFTLVAGVEHNALALMRGLGEKNWAFYRACFASKQAGSKAAELK